MKTTHLVVIGYSFPVFNREIDREILAAKKLQKVYLQDKEDQLDGIENRVKALLGKRASEWGEWSNPEGYGKYFSREAIQIERVNSTDQFHIPFELR